MKLFCCLCLTKQKCYAIMTMSSVNNTAIFYTGGKYEDLFRTLERDFSLAGYLVFSPLVYNQSGDNPGCGEDKKIILDHEAELKINKSDLVFVVDKDDKIALA